MSVTVTYHVSGKFEGRGKFVRYVGGETIPFLEIDPDMINVKDLRLGLKSVSAHVDLGKIMLYYKKSRDDGVDSYRFINNDCHIRDLCTTCNG
ncbi:hypothetical protein LINGRAHAP2_LOCUS15102, partial [Linum grandiflorum]